MIGSGFFLTFGILFPERLGLSGANARFFARYAYSLFPLLVFSIVRILRSDDRKRRIFVVWFYLVVYSIGISFSFDFELLAHLGIGRDDSPVRRIDPNVIAFVVSLATTLAVAFVPLLAAGLVLLAAAGPLWLLEQFLRGLRFFTWRIVAYRKGPVTGIIVIITAALTVLRLYLAR